MSMRLGFICLLVALVALTSQAMAVARGAPGVAGYFEICKGHDTVLVAVDETGKPTGKVAYCPDLVLSFLVFLAVAIVLGLVAATIALDRPRTAECRAPRQPQTCHPARAPPAVS